MKENSGENQNINNLSNQFKLRIEADCSMLKKFLLNTNLNSEPMKVLSEEIITKIENLKDEYDLKIDSIGESIVDNNIAEKLLIGVMSDYKIKINSFVEQIENTFPKEKLDPSLLKIQSN